MKITQKVKKILDNYESACPGTKANLARILMHGRLGGSGKMVILPVDQGFEHGPDRSFAPNPDAFDVLYKEGATAPKMMSVGLHQRLIGHPGRTAGLWRLLDYIQQQKGVWITRRLDIARHWMATHPYPGKGLNE